MMNRANSLAYVKMSCTNVAHLTSQQLTNVKTPENWKIFFIKFSPSKLRHLLVIASTWFIGEISWDIFIEILTWINTTICNNKNMKYVRLIRNRTAINFGQKLFNYISIRLLLDNHGYILLKSIFGYFLHLKLISANPGAFFGRFCRFWDTLES